MSFSVNFCKNTTANNFSCAPESELSTVWYSSQLTVALLTSYFDEDEFENSPIKYDITMNKFNSRYPTGAFS